MIFFLSVSTRKDITNHLDTTQAIVLARNAARGEGNNQPADKNGFPNLFAIPCDSLLCLVTESETVNLHPHVTFGPREV
jgi:hypothetical protein